LCYDHNNIIKYYNFELHQNIFSVTIIMPKRKSELRNSSITVENIEHLDLDSMTNEEINEMFDN